MSPVTRRAVIAFGLMSSASIAAVVLKPTRSLNGDPTFKLEQVVPSQLGEWRVDNSIIPIQPSPDVQRVLETTYDQTLSRTYRNSTGYRVMLALAYGGSQTDGMNYHRPEICYPAQGYPIRRKTEEALVDVGVARMPASRMVAGTGPRNEPITYWLVIGAEVSSFGLKRKLATMKYGLTGFVPDGMLVRVSSIDDDVERAFRIQEDFLRALLRGVDAADRRRFVGARALEAESALIK